MGILKPESSHIDPNTKTNFKNQYSIIDDKVVEVRSVIVHTFNIGDVEDPDLYAADPIWQWQQSQQGKWIMEHAVEQPVWQRYTDVKSYTVKYCIKAKLTAKDLTYFYIKWGHPY